MALKGTLYKNVVRNGRAGWRLQLEWTASRNFSTNSSTITAKLYWMSLGSSYDVHSSAPKTCRVYVGDKYSQSTSVNVSLSGNQKKLIRTYSRTIKHDSSGKLSVSLSAWLDAKVTLSGVFLNRVSIPSTTVTIDPIPVGVNGWVLLSGKWREFKDMYILISGKWRTVDDVYVLLSGKWRSTKK